MSNEKGFFEGFDADEDEATGSGNKKEKLLNRDTIVSMIYGFGDEVDARPETIAMLEEIARTYILEMTQNALKVGAPNRITVDDILYLVRHDAKKYSRVKELLAMNEELKKAKKSFDEPKFATS